MGHSPVREVRRAKLVTVNKVKPAVFAGWNVGIGGSCSPRALDPEALFF